ncbi:MAG: hypothetical protein O3A96_11595 [Proteobacteria bacterium]|nr:hypothetical protein [Pseudomonadota bacterium]
MLENLLKAAPPDLVTLDWIVARLSDRSFGLVILLIAVVLGAAILSLLVTAAAAWGTIEASLAL